MMWQTDNFVPSCLHLEELETGSFNQLLSTNSTSISFYRFSAVYKLIKNLFYSGNEYLKSKKSENDFQLHIINNFLVQCHKGLPHSSHVWISSFFHFSHNFNPC